MGTFNTKQLINASPTLIPKMSERLVRQFSAEGFEVVSTRLAGGGEEVSITKGGLFKAVLGMKTALKITLTPQGDRVFFNAGVGIFGRQAIPTVISMLFFWPVLLTQIWGLISQAQLDDRALALVEEVAATHPRVVSEQSAARIYCTRCGRPLEPGSSFCTGCGQKV